MKTYPHIIVESRDRHEQRRQQADTIAERYSIQWFAEFNLLQLQYVGEHGLPSCYAKPVEFLYDFWPDLPWRAAEQKATVQLMMSDARWPAAVAAVKESTGLDMQHEFEKALKDKTT